MNINEYDSNFDDVILIDKGFTESDDSHENTEESENTKKSKNYARSTKEQLKKLLSYKETHQDFVQGKASAKNQLEWDTFIVELNEMGPPYRTSEEWKVVWTNNKSNRKRREKSRKQSASKIPCKVPSTFKSNSIEDDSNTENVKDNNSARLALDNDSLGLVPSTLKSFHNTDSSEMESNTEQVTDTGYLAVENISGRLTLENNSSRQFSLKNVSGRLALVPSTFESFKNVKSTPSNNEKVTECKDSHLDLENDSRHLGQDQDYARLALNQDSNDLLLDPDSNHTKLKISYVEEDKENFQLKVIGKLDVLIKEQKQSNRNFAELIDIMKNKFC